MSSPQQGEEQRHEESNATAAEERTTTLKHNIEKALAQEKQDIQAGRLKDENHLDKSHDFYLMCEAARRGDLRLAQEQITKGVNINARDEYDYTPLILASLCGHFELVQMLLEQGAKCERDTFQGQGRPLHGDGGCGGGSGFPADNGNGRAASCHSDTRASFLQAFCAGRREGDPRGGA